MMKKHLFLLMAALLMAAVNANAATPKRGDVNGDGSVDVSDVTALVSIILSNNSAVTAADVNKDGKVDVSDVTALVAIILNPVPDEPAIYPFEPVDMGFSNGIKWAPANLLAEEPEDFGEYLAWGDLVGTQSGKCDMTWGNYTFWLSGNSIATAKYSKYVTKASHGNVDGKTVLEPEDDPATRKWGGKWRMPTHEEWDELSNESNFIWTPKTQNGHYGYEVKSKTSAQAIFLPLGGDKGATTFSGVDVDGLYWSASLDEDKNNAWSFQIEPKNAFHMSRTLEPRYMGLNIRPVYDESIVLSDAVILDVTSMTLSVGEGQLLTATVAPEEARNKCVAWSSSDTNVATVDAAGWVTAVGVGTATITAAADDRTGAEAVCEVKVYASHDYVDLGLPSGTLWASTNVGAETPEGYGDYYAWGETATKSDYSWNTYKWGTAENLTKYTHEGLTTLEAADDAATVNWGDKWCIPTYDQLTELVNNCSWEDITENGVKCHKVTGPNGNYIILPHAGYYQGTSRKASNSILESWTSTLSTLQMDGTKGAIVLAITGNPNRAAVDRCNGLPVRPVMVYKAKRVTELFLMDKTLTLRPFEYGYVGIEVLPVDADDPTLTWTSSNESIATVDADGTVTAWADGTCTITVTAADCGTVTASYTVKVKSFKEAAVDLGLPSGTLWSTCNIGATLYDKTGIFFAWGEVTPKDTYTLENYKWGGETDPSKYNRTDKLMRLEPADDAATVVWGSDWRMPTNEEFEELVEECTFTWGTQDGLNGFVVEGPSGATIFLPASGFIRDNQPDNFGICGLYWSSDCHEMMTSNALAMTFGNTPESICLGLSGDFREDGYTVRPVAVQKKVRVTGITLSASEATLQVGETLVLTKTVTPEDASYKTLTWTSSNEKVAIVDDKGVVTAVGEGTCTITAAAGDYSGVTASCGVRVFGKHEYVDLGLPSGTLWASTNVGALTEDESGDYFAWGETSPKESYTWGTYTLCRGTQDTMMKYCDDEGYCTEDDPDFRYMLEPDDDAATVNWGSDWCIPTPGQWQELAEDCEWCGETNENGVKGFRVTARNGNSIFLPMTGYKNGTRVSDTIKKGHFVSSLLDPDLPTNATTFSVPYKSGGSTYASTFTEARYYGYTVRPVKKQPQVRITDLVPEKSSVSIEVGDYCILSVTHEPANATETVLKWTTSNSTVASVANGVVTARAKGTSTITVYATDGSGVATTIVVKVIDPRPYMDLGLPSGTLWATMNLGAEASSQFGDYFAWGETEPKDEYTWANNKWVGDDECLLRYCTDTNHGHWGSYRDNIVTLLPSDDAATQNWGNHWRTPTKEEWDELLDATNCRPRLTTMNSVKVLVLTSLRNNRSLYLPAQGYYDGSSCTGGGTEGYYWSSEINPEEGGDTAFRLYFDLDGTSASDARRGYGYPVRAVAVKKVTHVTEIILTPSKTGVLDPDDTITLSATVLPAGADLQTLNWSSNNTAVATVTSNGTVKALAEGRATIKAAASSGAFATYIVRVAVPHTYVDLALPSGTQWATMNVGATTEEGEGDFFAWGETEPKTNYAASTYKHCETDMNHVTKYFDTDNLTRLQPEDDAATVNWGSSWVMPTKDDLQELIDHCTFALETVNGVDGVRFTGTNGNSIFFPKAGYKTGTGSEQAGSRARVWTSDLAETPFVAWSLITAETSAITYSVGRVTGFPVRPVSVTKVGCVTSVTLSSTQKTLDKGQTTTLTATVSPLTAENKTLAWSSDNEAVATVDANGKVTARGGGICYITAAATDGSGKQGTCQVTVYEYVDLGLPSGALWATTNVGAASKEDYGDYFAWGETAPKTSFSWSNYAWCNGSSTTLTKYCPSSNNGYNGQTDDLLALLQADDAAAQNWGGNWRIPTRALWDELTNASNCTTAWVTTESGVKGLLVTSKKNTGKSIFLPATGRFLETAPSSVGYQGYYSLSIVSASTPDKCISGYFNDEGTISATNGDRYIGRAIRPVKVVPVTSISLSYSSLELVNGATKSISVMALPDNASDKSVYWKTSNTSVAIVSSAGLVTAVGVGTATLTATARDGSGKKASCTVTVNPRLVTSITLSESTARILKRDKLQLTATVLPSNADNRNVVWSTNNSSVATVDGTGLVTAVGAGGATITATAADGSGIKASCTVTVIDNGLNGHEYVDLGLPSGLEWASMNVGASSELQPGNLYAWGEASTVAKTLFTWSNYKYYENSDVTKYNDTDNKDVVEETDDVASVAWQKPWRMPRLAEWDELNRCCTWEWVTYQEYSVSGYKVTGPNGRSIFLPAAGVGRPTRSSQGTSGYYWSNERHPEQYKTSYPFTFSEGSHGIYPLAADRYNGMSARPVSGTGLTWVRKITLNRSDMILQTNYIETLSATVTPSYATNKTIRWSSSNPAIATVDDDGRILTYTAGIVTIRATATDGSGVSASCNLVVTHCVNLGLPSGTLWATTNVGATSEDDYGTFFAWGERQSKTTFTLEGNKYYQSGTGYTRYNQTDGLTVLQPMDDAAPGNWGAGYCTPTAEQWTELSEKCTWTWTIKSNGVTGYTVRGPNGNSIFLPAAGRYNPTFSAKDTQGNYWSSNRHETNSTKAYPFAFSSLDHSIFPLAVERYWGMSVRPVKN